MATAVLRGSSFVLLLLSGLFSEPAFAFKVRTVERDAQPGSVIKVACVGASFTQGWRSTPGHDYPTQLARLLGPGYMVRNFGKGGTTALKAGRIYRHGRFRAASYHDSYRLRDALAFLPDVVITQWGSNDSKDYNWRKHGDEFVPDYTELVSMFQRLPTRPRIFVMVPPPLYKDGVGRMNATVINTMLDGQLRLIAGLQHAGVVDIPSAFLPHCPLPETKDCDWISRDHCHPNDAGYYQMALAVRDAIRTSP